MIASRRSFLFGGATLLAAPAIVRVASIMPVSVPRPTFLELCHRLVRETALDYELNYDVNQIVWAPQSSEWAKIVFADGHMWSSSEALYIETSQCA